MEPQCRSCGTINPPGSNFCFSCGNRIQSNETETAADVGPTAPEATATPGGLVCPRCYERNEPGSTYCFACGMPLEASDAPSVGTVRHVPAFALGRPGGFWVRALAYIIDGVLLTVAFAIVWPLISGESITDYWQSSDALAGGDLFSFALNLLYYTGGVALWSTTLGKRPLGLYVVRSDGSKVGPLRAAARYFAYFLSVFTLGIGFVMVALRQDKRALHDLVCDTVVIRR